LAPQGKKKRKDTRKEERGEEANLLLDLAEKREERQVRERGEKKRRVGRRCSPPFSTVEMSMRGGGKECKKRKRKGSWAIP